ncbi:hypothetical protein CI109_102564 [Kwoniella shandongensis]|uniref:Uncharacterized protein n=1 Tax=Kwoniella shandongensis TaxID=1734106 RepID=A0A5M6BSC2_9TREE|nr:uncharacterized protein CI109_005820 [Kwoniella shandongensis]KAA5525798.1 hypothetical protein CI109_005820 [Kwoniella shandongensis]
MRIHELLENCVEYIAYDGIVGTDPTRLIQHLVKLDPSLDHDYFTHIWTLLCAHPQIQIVVASTPILIPGGTTELGTAPLPADWEPPQHAMANIDLSSLYREGVKGRQLAYMLAGKEFKTGKQLLDDRRQAAKKKKPKTTKVEVGEEDDGDLEGVKAENGHGGYLRVLAQDDGMEEGEGEELGTVPTTDFRGLSAKWGARLRIRCKEDEIYYRLTGSHQKINKITAVVFHILQLTAMSREKGITAIDLGPLVGSSQGSMHYFMKVLVGMGLCAKVPCVLHGSITNLLVYHRFLDQNPNYLALTGKPLPPDAVLPQELEASGQRETQGVDDAEAADEEDLGDEPADPNVDDPRSMDGWGFNFGPLSETELMAGHIVKHRLLSMLDHPMLKNHLLATRNLLTPLGWSGPTSTRHRRAVMRQIDALVFDGVVERVAVGERETSCIRMVKYNPDRSLSSAPLATTLNDVEIEVVEAGHDLEVIAAQPPYAPPGGIPITLSLEYFVLELVAKAGANGITINEIWYNVSYMQKRGIDFAVIRADNAPIPSHLWSLGMSSTMETIGKERRLRLFTTEAYQNLMLASGQELEGYAALEQPENADQWSDISYKDFYSTVDHYYQYVEEGDFAMPTAGGQSAKIKGKKIAKIRKIKKILASNNNNDKQNDDDVELINVTATGRPFKYSTENQIRGRPRKYVHVVEEDGKVNRRIIGTVYSRPDLPPILIYMKHRDLLVEPPLGYAGIGPPPPPSEEAINDGKPPEWYFKFPTQHAAAHSGTTGRGKKKVKKESQRGSGSDDNANTPRPSKAKQQGKRKAKKGSGEEAAITQPEVRKSKRQRKEVKYKDAGDMEVDEQDVVAPEQNVNEGDAAITEVAPVGGGPSTVIPFGAASVEPSAAPAAPLSATGNNQSPITAQKTGADVSAVEISGQEPSSAVAEPLPADISVTDPPPISKGRGRAKQEPKIKVKQEAGPMPKRGRGRKSAAAEPQTAAPAETRVAVSTFSAAVPSTAVPAPKVSTEAEDQSLPVVAPAVSSNSRTPALNQSSHPTAVGADQSISFNQIPLSEVPMETSIGSILVELADSGLLDRSHEAGANDINRKATASTPSQSGQPAVQSSAVSTTDRAVDVSPNTAKAAETSVASKRTRKRKASPGPELPVPPHKPTTRKRAKGAIAKESAVVEGGSATETTQRKSAPRASIFDMSSQNLMEETPFELPSDIVGAIGRNRLSVTVDESPHQGLAAVATAAANEPFLHADGSKEQTGSALDWTPARAPTAIASSSTAPPTPASALPQSTTASMAPPATPSSPPETPRRFDSAEIFDRSEIPTSAESSRHRSVAGTPLREVQSTPRPLSRQTSKLARQEQITASGSRTRIDLGTIRRANELYQSLVDAGGILMNTKLQSEHRDWAHKHAGTDHPHAPTVAYGMDRSHVKKVISSLLKDGRVKETIVTTPTQTGRWVKTIVIYTSDLSDERRQDYIRHMSASMNQIITPLKKEHRRPTASLPNTPFTEIRGPTPRTASKMVTYRPRSGSQTESHRPYSETRAALVKEINVVSQLYGWKAGRCIRAQVLHRAIIKAFSEVSTSIISTSPRIFALPLLFEDITVGDWFACVLTLQFNEELEEWMHDPAHRALKVKQVPKHFKPPGGFSGHGTKTKLATLLQILIALKIISPVTPTDAANADLFADQSPMGQGGGFKMAEAGMWSTYYLVHDYAPVYHIALDSPPLLGLVPTKDQTDLDNLWQSIKEASLEGQVDISGKVTHHITPGLPTTARFTETADIGVEYMKMLQHRTRWRDEIHLLQVQKEALNAGIDWKNGQRLITTRQQVEDLAYEYALPPAYVESELDRRVALAREKSARRAERLRETAIRARERQERIQVSLREKLAERQQANRREWEARVQSAAERKGVPYVMEMLEFVSRQTVMSTSSTKQMAISNAMLDHWAGIWDLCRGMSDAEREKMLEDRKKQNQERQRSLAPKLKWTRTKAEKKKAPKGTLAQRRIRSKHKWTAEDDDLFLDAEAVIRARSRSNGYKGRVAMSQYYPEVSTQTFLARLKKIVLQPGKQAYLDRLEQAWFDVWTDYRGTAELPDENVDSSTEFDLKSHVQFLRSKVDKKSLKLLAASTDFEEIAQAPDLPLEVSNLVAEQAWSYVKVEEHTFDNIADSLSAEEIRVTQLAHLPLYNEQPSVREISPSEQSRQRGVLEATLKMIVGTPSKIYDPVEGDRLLKTWGSQAYDVAINDLVEKGVFKKQYTSGSTAGRFYDFTQQWHQLSDGALPNDLAWDASGLYHKIANDENGVEWPLVGKPGELAALMNMVSNHEVDFEFKVEDFPTISFEADHYNTRKLNDDVYEFDFRVKRLEGTSSRHNDTARPDPNAAKSLISWDVDIKPTSEVQQNITQIIAVVTAAGAEGITKPDLIQMLRSSAASVNLALAYLASRQPERESQVFWAGYDTARLVSRDHWESWAIKTRLRDGVNGEGEANPGIEEVTSPRRWVDLYGQFMEGEWNRAANAVITHVVTRPGLTERLLREKMESVLDRMEMNEILHHLVAKRVLKRRTIGPDLSGDVLPPVEAMDVAEEEAVGWWCDIEGMWR